MKEQNHIDKREKLIKIANQETEPNDNELDTFELEALEGLKLLEKKDKKIFTKIDQRIDDVLINKKRKKKAIVYLSLAASVVLVIGLSLIFRLSLFPSEKNITVADNSVANTVRKDSSVQLANVTAIEKSNSDNNTRKVHTETEIGNTEGLDAIQEEMEVEKKSIQDASVKDQNLETDESFKKSDQVTLTLDRKNEESSVSMNESMTREVSIPSSANAGVPAVAEDIELNEKKKSTGRKNKALEQQNSSYILEGRADNSLADTVLSEISISTQLETNPVYPGGQIALNTFFRNNIQLSDLNLVREKSIIISVYVNEKGKVSKYKILQSIPSCNDCSKEAIRVCGLMPEWNPATSNGKKIGKRVTFTITF